MLFHISLLLAIEEHSSLLRIKRQLLLATMDITFITIHGTYTLVSQ